MARSPLLASEAPKSAESEVVSALESITDELRVVRYVHDEIRTDFQWAVRNGRVVVQVQSPEPVVPELPEGALFNEGDAVEFDLGGEIAFGEIVEINDGLNRAKVQLIPSGRIMTVKQDDLQGVESDRWSITQSSEPATVFKSNGELPEPGELF